MNIDTIIFDLDGTLIDSAEDVGRAASIALEYWGGDIHPHFFETHAPFLKDTKRVMGHGLVRTIEQLAPLYLPHWDEKTYTQDAARIQKGISLAQEYYRSHLVSYTTVFPDILNMLRELVDRGIKISVLSNKTHDMVSIVLSTLFTHITWTVVQGKQDDGIGKPDPSFLLRAFSDEHSITHNAIMVGDMDTDVQTAINADIPFVGAGWGYYLVSIEAKDHTILSHPLDLLEYIAQRQ